ncbi:DUF4175 family protein [Acetobacteraceae bacterium ESL0709]|nr:DUF4175 family protein [Acetobacteraceae bacterium ESL0697]MDF7677848.1 DUF4175 family protein [Acetobacteraceae bacterium ESL0709]
MMSSAFTQTLNTARLKARRVLRTEQIWGEIRGPLALVFLWGLASLFHLPQTLPDALHALSELVILLACIGLFYYSHKHSSPPSSAQLDRLIEHSTLLSGHPLASLNDRPVAPRQALVSKTHLHIWHEYQRRLTDTLGPLKVRAPRFFRNWQERIAALVIILFYVIGLSLAGTHGLLRLKAGFIPGMDDDLVPLAPVQAWIIPPSFSKNTVQFLRAQNHKIEAPILQGSHFFAVITGGGSAPQLFGAILVKRQKLEDQSWKIEGLIRNNQTISLTMRGRTLASWQITMEKDLPPSIEWKNKPENPKNSWRTLISWRAHQSQGLKSLELVFTKAGQHPLSGYVPRSSHISLPLDGHPSSSEGQVSLDLSTDPFAGDMVEAYLQATSLSGLTAKSSPQKITLAARPFHDPLARALIALRKRVFLHEETQTQAFSELTLLSHLPMPLDIRAAFSQLLIEAKRNLPENRLMDLLWFLALYSEDRSASGTDVALSMAEFRAAQQDVLHSIDKMAGKDAFPLAEQEELHKRLERLKKALDDRMNLMFTQASQTGIVMPLPSEKGTPWQKLTHKIQHEALHGNTIKARNYLAELSDMAEQMRQAQKPDLQSLALQMKAQQEARDQRSALRVIIKDETDLLNRTHRRQAIQHTESEDQAQNDVTQMSTAALLRQLGITPPPNLKDDSGTIEPDIVTKQRFAEQRQQDYQTQQALLKLTDLLIKRGKDLTHKDNKAFERASKDMVQALKVIAQRDDLHTGLLQQKILEDLSQAQKEMKKNQHSMQKKSQGRLGFIPPPQSKQDHPTDQKNGGASEQDQDDNDMDEDNESEQSKNKDPLGRSLDKGSESDAHIPDNYKNKDYRSIERELRRRASDRTRPKAELDYLERLLKPFSHPDL